MKLCEREMETDDGQPKCMEKNILFICISTPRRKSDL